MNLLFFAVLINFLIATASAVVPNDYFHSNETQIDHHECTKDVDDVTHCTFNDVTDPMEFLIQLRGNYQNHSNIKKLKFVDSFLDFIPKEIYIFYTNLESIDISHINLARLESYDFVTNQLVMINASNNQLKQLGPRIVAKSAKLQSLDLSHNEITRINPSTFVFNSNFKYLNLSHNQITRLDFKFIEPIRTLEVFHMENNKLQEITGDFSVVQLHWNELYLNANKLKTLDEQFVQSISVLHVSHNDITEAKFHNTEITDLEINDNNLTILTVNKKLKKLSAAGNSKHPFNLSLEDNSSMKYLDLRSTSLGSIDDLQKHLKNLKDLKYLDLSSLDFDFNEETFKGLDQLETLKIAYHSQHLREIPKNVFKPLKMLTHLDISNGYFLEVDLKYFDNLKNLKTLDMNFCWCRKLLGWQNISKLLPSLAEINIFRNRFDCSETRRVIEEFKRVGITMIDMDVHGEDKYIKSSCKHPKDDDFTESLASNDKQSSWITNKFVWIFLTLFVVICVVIGVILYIKFEVIADVVVKYRHTSCH